MKNKLQLEIKGTNYILEYTNRVVFEIEDKFDVNILSKEVKPYASMKAYIGAGLLKNHKDLALDEDKLVEFILDVMNEYDVTEVLEAITEILTEILNVSQNVTEKKKIRRL